MRSILQEVSRRQQRSSNRAVVGLEPAATLPFDLRQPFKYQDGDRLLATNIMRLNDYENTQQQLMLI